MKPGDSALSSLLLVNRSHPRALGDPASYDVSESGQAIAEKRPLLQNPNYTQ